MKVLDIYSKKDLELITYKKKTISKIMDDFFEKFPREYRINYDRNLEDLEMIKVDEFSDYGTEGEYDILHNVVIFKDMSSLLHEFIHLSTYDRESNQFAFCRTEDCALYERALIEGMTEYLASMIRDSKPVNYYFEVFVASMLSSVDRIFEPFFIPSYDEFIKLFPNKKDIISLMYSLDFYKTKISSECITKRDIRNVKKSISNTIDCLINIELFFDKEFCERETYSNKFMDLITSEKIDNIFGYFFEDYKDYAFDQVKKRVLGRN